ncbi:MAG: glycosyltransferase family 39 protein [Polyangiaceae bacterium]
MTNRALVVFALVTAGLTVLRVAATRDVGFGDSEALYASYALFPAPTYLDHPGLVGVAMRAIARMGGDAGAPTPFHVHLATTVLAGIAPWVLLGAARLSGAPWHRALMAATVYALVPEIAIGLFAMTPDLLLAYAWPTSLALAVVAFRAPPGGTTAWGAFAVLGTSLGIAVAAKVSAIPLGLAFVVLLVSRPFRPHLRTVPPWAGLALAALVVFPLVRHEGATGWPMLAHRFVATQSEAGVSPRNALAIVFGQLAYLSPFGAFLVVVLGVDLWRRRREDATSEVLAAATFVPLAVLLPLCLWSRVAEPHWLAPAFLALPVHAARRGEIWTRRNVRAARGSAVTGMAVFLLAHLWVLVPKVPSVVPEADAAWDIASELHGWPQVTRAVEEALRDEEALGIAPSDAVVVGPHWVLCAQLRAALPAAIMVGCTTPKGDDFARWAPRTTWEPRETIVHVSDTRFPTRPSFHEHDVVRTREVPIVRGGRRIRTFTVTVLRRHAAT